METDFITEIVENRKGFLLGVLIFHTPEQKVNTVRCVIAGFSKAVALKRSDEASIEALFRGFWFQIDGSLSKVRETMKGDAVIVVLIGCKQ